MRRARFEIRWSGSEAPKFVQAKRDTFQFSLSASGALNRLVIASLCRRLRRHCRLDVRKLTQQRRRRERARALPLVVVVIAPARRERVALSLEAIAFYLCTHTHTHELAKTICAEIVAS